ncbi:hypothetical protein SAMN02745206_00966 [Desulfacinum infernum DSM 9756]|uniref:Uncharacterized protein n=1 Tax=Desulfacinum infernum DSM 9756 TaxID=1121391 RepID=A0A1M4X3S3_9BACT|nr:hypothetical protein SAMN02745206_00966 [Desulfacinum infernum DSM 9756]
MTLSAGLKPRGYGRCRILCRFQTEAYFRTRCQGKTTGGSALLHPSVPCTLSP